MADRPRGEERPFPFPAGVDLGLDLRGDAPLFRIMIEDRAAVAGADVTCLRINFYSIESEYMFLVLVIKGKYHT